MAHEMLSHLCCLNPSFLLYSRNHYSPGLIDIQLNGAYGFDFSVFDGDEEAYKQGMKLVAEKIVETGVTS